MVSKLLQLDQYQVNYPKACDVTSPLRAHRHRRAGPGAGSAEVQLAPGPVGGDRAGRAGGMFACSCLGAGDGREGSSAFPSFCASITISDLITLTAVLLTEHSSSLMEVLLWELFGAGACWKLCPVLARRGPRDPQELRSSLPSFF